MKEVIYVVLVVMVALAVSHTMNDMSALRHEIVEIEKRIERMKVNRRPIYATNPPIETEP